MKDNTIASEAFFIGKKELFLDFKLARNKSNYMRITNLVRFEDGSTRKARLYIWQEDFELWISAFASLFNLQRMQLKRCNGMTCLIRKTKGESGIKSWNPEKRPREKFLENGPGEMTLAELIAMLIGSGTADANAVELGEKILKSVDNDLSKLSELSHIELAKFKGMGLAKSSAILSALELGKERSASKVY